MNETDYDIFQRLIADKMDAIHKNGQDLIKDTRDKGIRIIEDFS